MAADFTAEVWPDTAGVVELFIQLDTQWRVGPGGPYGLDYNAIPFVLRTAGIPRPDWPDTFEAIRIMERAALAEMHSH